MKQTLFLIIVFITTVFSIFSTGDIAANIIIKTDEFLILHSEVNPIFYLAIVTTLLGIGFTYFYRKIIRNSLPELEDLKHNISLLRDEKLGSQLNIKSSE